MSEEWIYLGDNTFVRIKSDGNFDLDVGADEHASRVTLTPTAVQNFLAYATQIGLKVGSPS